MLNQQYQEPWLAVVIDPTRTASTGKVEIGAFRTYPQARAAAATATLGGDEGGGLACLLPPSFTPPC